TFARVGRRFGLSPDALRRHAAAHLAAGVASGDARSLAEHLRALHVRTMRALRRAEREGDLRMVLMGLRAARANLELSARLAGELHEVVEVDLLAHPQWLALRRALFEALAPYAEARFAVARRLAALEEEGDELPPGLSGGSEEETDLDEGED